MTEHNVPPTNRWTVKGGQSWVGDIPEVFCNGEIETMGQMDPLGRIQLQHLSTHNYRFIAI